MYILILVVSINKKGLLTVRLFFTGYGVVGLRDVSVKIPPAVSPGDTVTLYCQYDLENEPLYTVKWYKGRQEFFRYIPKELPNTKVFPLADIPGFTVDVSIFYAFVGSLF